VAELKYILEIDKEFKRLITPLSPDERKQLEENIVQDGCREPLCVWNNTILDGHNRYEICTLMNIPFSTVHIFLKSREDAIAWICANQLGRRNISESSRRYLIGKRYEAEKRIGSHNPVGINQYRRKEVRYKNLTEPPSVETAGRTRERLGNEYNISDHTVVRYGNYTKAIDSLSKASPELTPKILTGKIKITHDDVVALSQFSPTDISNIAEQLKCDPENAVRYIKARQVMKSKRQIIKPEQLPNPTVAIKETPAYDPDASVGSLTFTIPSWISTIERTATETDYKVITLTASLKLKQALLTLVETAQTMLDIMEETAHDH